MHSKANVAGAQAAGAPSSVIEQMRKDMVATPAPAPTSGGGGGSTNGNDAGKKANNTNWFKEWNDRIRANNIRADLETGGRAYGGMFSSESDLQWYAGYLISQATLNDPYQCVLINDVRQLQDVNSFIGAFAQNGVYQLLAGMHAIAMVVYNGAGGRMFYATELVGSGDEFELGKIMGATTFGFNGKEYELREFSGTFDAKGASGFFNRLDRDPTPVTIFDPTVTERQVNLANVAISMQARCDAWDVARPTYHAYNNLIGVNSNTYANDIISYAAGKGAWISIPGLPGAYGQDFLAHRP